MSQSLNWESHRTTCSQNFPSPEDLHTHIRIYEVYSLVYHMSHDANIGSETYISAAKTAPGSFDAYETSQNFLRG